MSSDTPITSQPTAESEDHLLLRRALGKTVRRLRREEEISQSDLAVRAGLAMNHIGEIERVPRNLTLQTIALLARAFDMQVSELLALAEELARKQTAQQPRPEAAAAL